MQTLEQRRALPSVRLPDIYNHTAALQADVCGRQRMLYLEKKGHTSVTTTQMGSERTII